MKLDVKAFERCLAEKILTRGQVIKKAGISHVTLDKAQSGKDITPATLGKIAKAMGVPVTELIANE